MSLTLLDEILNGPKSAECAPFVVTNDMPKDAGVFVKDQAIAEILSIGRTEIRPMEVGDGAVSIALGLPDGPVFIYRLRKLAAVVLADDAPIEQVIPTAIAQQVSASLAKGALDVGNPTVREGFSFFIGNLLTAEQAEKIKKLAEVDVVITPAEVSRALRGPWE